MASTLDSDHLVEIEKLSGVQELLGWDEMVMLAEGSSAARADQKAALATVLYEKKTSPALKKIIDDLKASDLSTLDNDFDRANVRDAARDFDLTRYYIRIRISIDVSI